MKLSPERKRLAFLVGALVLLGGYSLYTNVLSGPSSSPPPRPKPTVASGKTSPVNTRPPEPRFVPNRPAPSSRSSEEFRPSLKPKRPEDRVDPMSIDPTLRLDLLAKVQAVSVEGGSRNLFQVGAQPLPPEPLVPVRRGVTQVAGKTSPELPPSAAPPMMASAPVAPPITLKYYGYSSARGDNRKRAFFLDGEDILVAGEGETVKKRYRVVHIGVNSVVMEDTQFKHEQTLQLQEEAAG